MIFGPQTPIYGAEERWRRMAIDRLSAKDAAVPWAGDLAAGVAAWCAGAVRSDWVRLDQFDAWLAHALCAVGRPDAANRMAPPGRRPFAGAVSATSVCGLARDGILSAGRIGIGGEGAAWKMDLHRLAGAPPCLEMRAYRMIQAAIERLTHAWHEHGSASPRLALTGLRRLAREIEGAGARRRRVRHRAADLRGFIRILLDRYGCGDAQLCILDLDT